MKCPNCKTKKPLKTKRTLAHGRECKRERFCLVCKKNIWTIELFQDDYDKEIEGLENECRNEERRKEEIEYKYKEVGEALRMIIQPVKKK